MNKTSKILTNLLAPVLFVSCINKSESSFEKITYFPSDIWKVEEGNDFSDSLAQFSQYRMKETDNLAILWEQAFGDNPATADDEKYRFDMQDLMAESERMFVFYRDSLKFIEKGHSLTDSLRMLIFAYHNDDGTVYGGGAGDSIGVVWLSPNRIQKKPYAAMAHELGHAFQFQVACDGNDGFDPGSIYEMTSQYMLFQFYPNWMQLETYHFDNFMKNTHKAFLHEDNMYCTPYVLEYWSNKYGREFIGKLWQSAKKGEDPVLTYKRIQGMDQTTFNNEIADAYLKFMTWDMDRIRNIASEFANKHICKLNPIKDGWYQISEENCPQNYGYNGIRLTVPERKTKISMEFNGLTKADGYNIIQTDKAGWRYGFVAELKNKERIYSPIFSNKTDTVTFTVPDNTANLWLMVCGAPTEHWIHKMDFKPENDEQWPYQIRLSGTTIFNDQQTIN